MSSVATSPLRPLALGRPKTPSLFFSGDARNWVAGVHRRGERKVTLACSASSFQTPKEAEGWEGWEEWLKKLPDQKKPLYSHSLPCIEAWLRSLGFNQNRDDRAVWLVETPSWHAKLSLDVTDLSIRYFVSFFLLIESVQNHLHTYITMG